MPPKRPHTNPFGDDSADDSASISANGHAASPPSPHNKKQRTNHGPSPSPSAVAPPSGSAASKPSISSIQAQLAAAKAKINAQMAGRQPNNESFHNRNSGAGVASSSASSSSSSLPPSAPKVGSTALPPTSSAANRNFDIAAIKRQIEEGKRKAAAGQQAQKSSGSQNANTTAPSGSTTTSTSRPTGIHPLLMQTGAVPASSGSTSSRSTPSYNTLRKGAQPAAAIPETVNPYLSAAQEDEQDGGQPGTRPPGSRSMHRTLKFNRQGRHIQAAEEARREAELEALKKRIQESAKRAGMQEELTGEERKIKRQPPPDVEWWDAALLPSGNYDCVPDDYPPDTASTSAAKSKSSSDATSAQPLITGQGTPIDIYIQHPIPIPAPNDKFKVEPKGVMLTKKEMKKMRKQRRLAEQQDKQDRIKMGLQPPDPPKVKLSNLMRVLASEQVADPTKVEARVRRQVAARKEQHEKDNAERALTPDQRREKAAMKMDKDEAKGTFVCVYKIKHLVSGAHKFKVRKNAQQNGLTGLCIFHPDFALVLVEGPSKGIKAYKRLMTVRIDWTDPGRPKDSAGDADEDDAAAGGDPYDLNRSSGISARFLAPMGEVQQPTQFEKDSTNAALVDWTTNTCQLIFEGPQRERYFPQGFRARNADTDYDAREILGTKWSGFWDVAKKFESAREED